MKKLSLKSFVLPFLSFFLAIFIGGLLIAFSDPKVLKLRGDFLEMIRVGANTAWSAYVALFQGAIYDPNLAAKGGGQGFYPLSETLVVSGPLILAGLAVAGALAASGAAHARVTPNDNTDHSNRFNITHTHQDVKKDSEKKDANAPSHSKEYLKSVVDGSHPRPLITKERAQELLKKHYNEQKNYEEEPTNPNIKLRSGALKHHEKGVKLDTEEGWEDHEMKDQKQPVWGKGTQPRDSIKDIDNVNAAGQEPHPEEWEDFKKKTVKEAEEQNFTDKQVELDDLNDEEINSMIDSIKDENDIMDAYDDAEFAVVDDESGEEIPEEDKAVKEETINEVLSRSERMRARVRFEKTKSKRERSVKLALKRSSSVETINKRARRLAIVLMKKKIGRAHV